ncbi:hypothetical protein CHS0354_033834 [Potamilus streckersoni]|uniref:Uncharacterized protein n=1 Tax=Potamilus streckersoni TaxID=2493646 RepID=A0AAE0T7M1_9BIVA|nr:hypothetical protein CHS0354_033834 [Potamilus streckersoni]
MTNKMTRSANGKGEVKRPRLRLVEIAFNSKLVAEGLINGRRPHGGTRGSRKYPLSPYSFQKEASYHQQLQEDIDHLISEDDHDAPYWALETQKEITHSGESPLFVHKLLASSKFEQEHGEIKFQRSLASSSGRRSAPPMRNGKMFYRPNRTHQYLSATDLRDLAGSDAQLKYGRPTRTTLLRARHRTTSTPINLYESRREMVKRAEEVKINSVYSAPKEFFNLYTSDGESAHAFITGARYNRARFLDAKGLTMYGVYMPRDQPQNCFITGSAKMRDVGDDIPSAPPDSPRSDTDIKSTPSQSHHLPRPASYKFSSIRKSLKPSVTRPRSAWEGVANDAKESQNVVDRPKSAIEGKKDIHDEVIVNIPDLKGRGVTVILKGQRLVEAMSSDSKLPRVQGVSVPKVRKSDDPVDEMFMLNQPPSTPINLAEGEKDNQDLESMSVVKPSMDRNADYPSEKTRENQLQRKDLQEEKKEEKNKLMDHKQIRQGSQTVLIKAEGKALHESPRLQSKQESKQNPRRESIAGDFAQENQKENDDKGDAVTIVIPLEGKMEDFEVAEKFNEHSTKNEEAEIKQNKYFDKNVTFFITEEGAEDKLTNGSETHDMSHAGKKDASANSELKHEEINKYGSIHKDDMNDRVTAKDDMNDRITADDFPFENSSKKVEVESESKES